MSNSPTGCSRADHPVLRLAGDFSPVVPGVRCRERGSIGRMGGAANRQAAGCRPAASYVRRRSSSSTRRRPLASSTSWPRRSTAIKLGCDGDPAASNERGQLALLGLIQIARGDDAAAAQAIDAIKPLLDKLSADAPSGRAGPSWSWPRGPSPRPSLRQPAVELLDTMADRPETKKPPRPSTS